MRVSFVEKNRIASEAFLFLPHLVLVCEAVPPNGFGNVKCSFGNLSTASAVSDTFSTKGTPSIESHK